MIWLLPRLKVVVGEVQPIFSFYISFVIIRQNA